VNYLRVEEDRRTYERLPVSCPVTFTHDSIQSRGSIEDISMAGCAMLAEDILAPGTILQMALHISDDVPPVGVTAAVVRNVRRRRVGVEFLQLKKTERDRLRDFIQAALRRRQMNQIDSAAADQNRMGRLPLPASHS
jgi:c-di-GMP-binding flagellar brake protein YcgR